MGKIKEAVKFINQKTNNFKATIGIILGTGLGGLVEDIAIDFFINYEDIPHFPLSTVEGHSGRLIFGQLSGRNVIVMQGRFHYYEGYNMKQVTFPVRVMKPLGIEQLIVSNVSGSTNASINKGDLVFIKDHIYLQYENPLTGKNLDEFGPRFPDMSQPYSLRLIEKAEKIAKQNNFNHHRGVYASVPGPNLETKAEYNYINIIGGDIVGMSTAPEVIVAVHCGLEVFSISVVTDKNFPIEEVAPVTVEEVIAIALQAEPKMTTVVKGLIKDM
ncbi:UNVERIFIED_CONTAM: hypothetical protein GTU68_031888 [Idotea baltica]|nr:hypothetical protein [Idotea baltica]